MWNRRKEEEYAPNPALTPSTKADFAKEHVPVSTMPVRNFEPESSRGGSAVIGKSVVLKGQIFSREDLYIDGEVEGNVELQEHRLTVGPNGKVSASVKAREIVVLGTITGNVEAADKIDIRKDAKLVGDIKTARIVIEDGAYFKGSIDIVKTEVKKKDEARIAVPLPVSSAAPEVPLAASSIPQKR